MLKKINYIFTGRQKVRLIILFFMTVIAGRNLESSLLAEFSPGCAEYQMVFCLGRSAATAGCCATRCSPRTERTPSRARVSSGAAGRSP